MMATYNGATYLAEQIQSIINQSFSDWKLYIKDDGSSDGTLDIIESFGRKFDGKIVNLSNISGGGNAKDNFFALLNWVSNNTDSDYFMFSDQDDVWLPDKIQNSVDVLAVEQGPALVHTDLLVVDHSLHTITDSFAEYSHLRTDFNDLSHLLVQNNVTGCTMIWNKKLNNLIKPNFNKNIVMHDWWISLIAAAFGTIMFVDKATIMYRQHSNNVVGAHRVGSLGYIQNKLSDVKAIRQGIRDTYSQATAFYEQYGSELSSADRMKVSKYIELSSLSKPRRVFGVLKYRFLKQSLLQSAAQLVFV